MIIFSFFETPRLKTELEPRTSQAATSQDALSVGTLSIRGSCTSAESSVYSNVVRFMTMSTTANHHSCANTLIVRTRAIDHHYYLCPNAELSKGTMGQKRSKSRTVRGGNERNYTEAQEEFFRKLSPESAQQCKDTFCNTAVSTSYIAKSHSRSGPFS